MKTETTCPDRQKDPTLLEILNLATQYFKDKGIASPRLDAEVLMSEILECDRVGIYLQYAKPLFSYELDRFRDSVRRRAAREPVAYITGKREFWSLSFTVDERVLIPRPETELLVETCLEHLKGIKSPQVLELCTGSGAVAISLGKELSSAVIVATDIMEDALDIARLNAGMHEISGGITFMQSDLFDRIEGTFDAVVVNPPYIPSEDLCNLSPEIHLEPQIALDGGPDGLEVIRRIVKEAPAHLKAEGKIMIEIGAGQSEAVMGLFKEKGDYAGVEAKQDLAGIDRLVMAWTQ